MFSDRVQYWISTMEYLLCEYWIVLYLCVCLLGLFFKFTEGLNRFCNGDGNNILNVFIGKQVC